MGHTINTSGLVYEQNITNANLAARSGTVTLTGDGHSHLFRISAANRESVRDNFGRTYYRYYWTYDIQKMCSHADTAHLARCCKRARRELQAELKDYHEEFGSKITAINWA